jgi:hypothetical protein
MQNASNDTVNTAFLSDFGASRLISGVSRILTPTGGQCGLFIQLSNFVLRARSAKTVAFICSPRRLVVAIG